MEEDTLTESTETDVKMGDWLEFSENFQEIESIDYDEHLPEVDLTSLPYIRQNYDVLTLENVNSYYQDFCTSKVDLRNVNGMYLENFTYKCDYCGIYHEVDLFKECLECKKNMCSECFLEKTEEIAIRNGAKNWLRRKDALLRCFHGNHTLINKGQLSVRCDVCGDSSNRIEGKWKCNRLENKDVCPECVDSMNGIEFMNRYENGWINYEFKPVFEVIGYNSVWEWLPILRDKRFEDFLAYNANKHSRFYQKVALCCKDHNDRWGYFVVEFGLEDALNLLESVKHGENKEYGVAWKEIYGTPIKKLALARNFAIYY